MSTIATISLVEETEVLLDLFDSHDVVKKAFKDAYAIRRSQVITAIEQAKNENNELLEALEEIRKHTDESYAASIARDAIAKAKGD